MATGYVSTGWLLTAMPKAASTPITNKRYTLRTVAVQDAVAMRNSGMYYWVEVRELLLGYGREAVADLPTWSNQP